MALEYRHPLGIMCDGSEGQISTLFENLLDNHDKKVTGSSPKSVNKGTRELNRYSVLLTTRHVVEALLVVDAKGGCTTVYYEGQNSFLEC
jgi:hypothetical protein